MASPSGKRPAARETLPPRKPPASGRGGGAPPREESTVLHDTVKGRSKGRAAAPEHTMLLDINALEVAAPRAKLVGLRGRRRGAEFALRGTELMIGRDEGSDIVIADISVSRQHAQLRRTAEGWLIKDAGGGNGTRVNGLSIDEVLLHDGDLVELGTTELQFVEPPPPPPEAEAVEEGAGEAGRGQKGPSPRVKKLAIGVGALFFVLIALKLALPSAHTSLSPTSGGQTDEFAVARKLILGQKWEDAKAALVKAQADDPDNPEIKRYLDTISAEIVNQRHLDNAKADFAKSDLVGTLRELQMVGTGSLLSDDAAKVKGQVDAAVTALIQQAHDELDKGELADAKQHLDKAMGAEPDQPKGVALLPRLSAALAEADVRAHIAAQQRALSAADQRIENGPVGQARRAFTSGDVNTALGILGSANGPDALLAAELGNKIRMFSMYYSRGKQAVGRNTATAVDQLTRAHSLAIDIGNFHKGVDGETGALAVSSGKLLAQVQDQLGRAARSARAFDKAYKHFAAALAANRSDGEAKENVARLASEAKDLYLTSYGQMQIDPSAAIRGFKLVLSMTGPDDPYHSKAKDRLADMTGGGR